MEHLKKFELNLDAAVVLIVVFVGLIAANWYQSQKYDDLFTDMVQVQWKLQDAETNVHYFKGLLDQCTDSHD